MRKYKINNHYNALSLLSTLAMTLMLLGCASESYFLGNLHRFEDIDKTTQAKSSIVRIDSLHSPYFAVADSLAVFYNPLGKGYSFMVFNIKDGKLIGGFCPVGHGAGEYVAVSPIKQLIRESGEVKAILFAPNEKKLTTWNITRSIRENSTRYERSVNYARKNSSPASYSRIYYISRDTLLTYKASVHVSDNNDITEQRYELRSYNSDETLADIQVFSDIEEKEKSAVLAEDFFYISNAIKPDRTKIVEVMYYLPQINIIDIATGEVSGYLMDGEADYSIFDTDMRNIKKYYNRVVCDDNYIYALWSGKTADEHSAYVGNKELHVYDWNGQLTNKVILENPADEMFVDSDKGILYVSHPDRNTLDCYNTEEFTR